MDRQVGMVRHAEPNDAHAIAELCGELGYPRSAEDVLAWFASAQDARSQTLLVAEADGRVLGWIEVAIEHHVQSEPYALISGLVVREGARGLHIGQRLCEDAEHWAAGQGVRLMRVTSRSTRHNAHRFYLRDGYEIVKTSAVFEKHLPG